MKKIAAGAVSFRFGPSAGLPGVLLKSACGGAGTEFCFLSSCPHQRTCISSDYMYLAHLSGSAQSLGRLVSPKLTKLTDRFRRSTSTPTSSSPMSSTSAAAAVTARGNQYTSYAEEQFTKAGGSGLYDRARPDYPAEAVSRILARLPRQQQQEQRAGENQGNLIVELGSGTGIFTRLLLKAGGGGAGQGSFKRLLCVEVRDWRADSCPSSHHWIVLTKRAATALSRHASRFRSQVERAEPACSRFGNHSRMCRRTV